jgi:flagellar assembly protein FliH
MGASDRIFARTIPKDEVGDAATWKPRSLGEQAQVSRSAAGLWSERERLAYERGREQGSLEATEAAARVRAGHLERIARLIGHLQLHLDEVAADGADCLLDLALDVARQVLRREIQIDRGAALPAIREAVAMITDHAAHPRIHISPEDFELVRNELQSDATCHGCRFIADPAIEPGGCRIDSPHGQIDGTVRTRWRRVIAALGAKSSSPSDQDPADETGRTHGEPRG